MLNQRILTAVIMGIPLLGLVFLGDIWFTGLLILMGIVGFYEMLRMKGYHAFDLPSLAGFLLTVSWILTGMNWVNALHSTMLLWAVYGLLFLTVVLKNRYTFQDMGYILLGTVYVGLSLHYVDRLRGLDQGLFLLLFVLFVIWSTDIGAFFIGRAMKGPKLWPAISPNKTISGSVGGILLAVLVSIGFAYFSPTAHPVGQWMVLAAVISMAGQVGDFVESGIKRSMDVKDSGKILPGHGGVLDRFDSLLFAAPIAYYLLMHVFAF